jgi:hypothetical protein
MRVHRKGSCSFRLWAREPTCSLPVNPVDRQSVLKSERSSAKSQPRDLNKERCSSPNDRQFNKTRKLWTPQKQNLPNHPIHLVRQSHELVNQNASNKRNYTVGKSGYHGVAWHENKQRFVAVVQYKGKKHHIGIFKDPVEAARARDEAALEIQGKYAVLNFPGEVQKRTTV